MPRGIVKWYNPNRGFGFISPEDGTEVVFADCEDIVGKFKELKEGLEVDYKVLNFKKGKQAVEIKMLNRN
ncbi:cold-shock protein [Pedobacter paludis]|uniref:Cold-shock protein n=1 Tax=Pedobacter paludis TaxID=2203212 RepID=A0A317F505_9SPHI|nr:cold shock domain-containing protein [Pedobacter paludis]PWS33127.1 cold-shock protein [Pedobacter paludis]